MEPSNTKIASRKKEQLMLIMSFSHVPSTGSSSDQNDVDSRKPKKVGFICSSEAVQLRLTEAIKQNYNVLKGRHSGNKNK